MDNMSPIYTLQHHDLVGHVVIGFSQFSIFHIFLPSRNIYLIDHWEVILTFSLFERANISLKIAGTDFEANPVIFYATVGSKNVPCWKPCFWVYFGNNFLIMIIDWLKILSSSCYIQSSVSWNFQRYMMYHLENRFLRGRGPLKLIFKMIEIYQNKVGYLYAYSAISF